MTDNESPEESRDPSQTRIGGEQRLITHWARSPYWSPEEGAVLAYDLDPKEAIEPSVTGYDGPRLRSSADARPLWDHAHRAVEVGALEERAAPIEFMKWARSIGVEFHPDWWDAVVDEEALTKDVAEAPPPATPVLELKTREQESLLKMVAAMAMAWLRLGPERASKQSHVGNRERSCRGRRSTGPRHNPKMVEKGRGPYTEAGPLTDLVRLAEFVLALTEFALRRR